MKAIGKKVILDPIIVKEASGIIIPDSAEKEKPSRGKVVDAGECEIIKADDVVIFRKYSAEEIEADGKLLLVVEEVDVLCVE